MQRLPCATPHTIGITESCLRLEGSDPWKCCTDCIAVADEPSLKLLDGEAVDDNKISLGVWR